MESKSIENAGETYDAAHKHISGLLGEAYNQDKVDAIAGEIGLVKVLEEVEAIRSSTNPEERRRYVNDWYKGHKVEEELLDVN